MAKRAKVQHSSDLQPGAGLLQDNTDVTLNAAKQLAMQFSDASITAIHRVMILIACCSPSQGLRHGSFCTGSGIDNLVVSRLLEVVQRLSPLLTLLEEVVFACEQDEAKAKWLRSIGTGKVFKNVEEMGDDMAYEWNAGKYLEVPDVDLLTLRFSCKDFSLLNANCVEMTDYVLRMLQACVESDTLETDESLRGSTLPTLLGSLRYVKRRRPAMVFMENVEKAILVCPLLTQIFASFGYLFTWTNNVALVDLRVPCARARVYMFALRRSCFAGFTMEALKDQFESTLERTKRKLRCLPIQDLRDYALADSQYVKNLATGQRTQRERSLHQDAEWFLKHNDAFRLASLATPTALALQQFESALPEQWLRDLFAEMPLREQEVIYYFHLTKPAGGGYCIDASQSIDRITHSQHLPCFHTNSKIWVDALHRELVGREKLALQGMSTFDFAQHAPSDRLLADLAGNAYHSPCILMVFMSMFESISAVSSVS